MLIFELQKNSLLSQLVIGHRLLIVTAGLCVALDLLLGALVASTDLLYELIDLLAVGVIVETLGRGVCEPLGGAINTPR